MAIEFEHASYRVIAADYHPGQGKMGGVTHARLHNLDTGNFRDYSFRADVRLQELPVQRMTLQFLYAEEDRCCFMEPESCEQIEIPREMIGPRAIFLDSGLEVPVEFVGGRPASVLFPDVMEVRIEDTAPAGRQQADGAFKSAKLFNGIEVMVPAFIRSGDVIRLDLRTMKYLDRTRHESKA